MNAPKSIVVMGEAGTGKTTLINGLRTPEYEDTVVIPQRFMTRPERSDDNPLYTRQLSKQEFAERVIAGLVEPYWSRKFGEGQTEYYGYEPVEPSDERLRIYGVKNPFLHPEFRNILSTGFIVSLHAPVDLRTDRILERGVSLEPTPSDNPAGVTATLSHENSIRIDTSALAPEQGQAALRQIVDEILANK